MPTTTANLGLTLPTPNVDTGWGSTLNTDFTTIDNLFASNGTGTSVGLQVGSGKTLVLGGTMVLGAGDGTGTVTAPTIRGAARTGTNVAGANLTIDAANGTGTGGSGSLIFRTAPPGAAGVTANTFQNSLVIDSSGNVAIGTNSTSSKLEVGGFLSASEYSSSVDAGGRINFNASTAAGTSTPIAIVKGLLINGTASFSGDLGLYTSSGGSYSLRLRIGSLGQVGINGANYGTAGQVLTSNGAGSSVSWTTPTVTTNDVLNATAGASVGAVGTYALLRFITGTVASPGTTHSGASLYYANAYGGVPGQVSPAGTWRLMGATNSGATTDTYTSLFLRIA